MRYKEKVTDLFEFGAAIPDCYYVHCISADFALGKGIAVEFCKRFDTKNQLNLKYKNSEGVKPGVCLETGFVFNLVTKVHYYDKPTYESMRTALESLKVFCEQKCVKHLVMPAIGCGLDGLKWYKVLDMIKEVFKDSADLELTVCMKGNSTNSLSANANVNVNVIAKKPLSFVKSYVLSGDSSVPEELSADLYRMFQRKISEVPLPYPNLSDTTGSVEIPSDLYGFYPVYTYKRNLLQLVLFVKTDDSPNYILVCVPLKEKGLYVRWVLNRVIEVTRDTGNKIYNDIKGSLSKTNRGDFYRTDYI